MEKISNGDLEAMLQALALLESTEYYQSVQEDPDWNITQSVDHLKEAIAGSHWI